MAKFRNRPQPLIKEKLMSDTPAQDPIEPTQPVDQAAVVTDTVQADQAPTTEAPVAELPPEAPVTQEAPVQPVAEVQAAPVQAPVVKEALKPQPTKVVTPAPVKPAAPAPQPAPVTQAAQADDAQDPEMSEEQAYLEKIAVSGTTAQKRILQAVQLFVERTQPRKPMKRGEGMQAQAEFLDHLFWLLDCEPSEFQKGWATLLVFFKAYHGDTNSPRIYSALSEYRSCDFREDWQDVERMQAYTNLVTLLRATRHKPTRSHDVKRVKLDMISPQFVTDHRLENLQRFYSV